MNKPLWYFAEGQRVLGPFEFEQLVHLVRTGRIVASTMVRSTEHDDWTEAVRVHGLIVDVVVRPPWGDSPVQVPPPPPPVVPPPLAPRPQPRYEEDEGDDRSPPPRRRNSQARSRPRRDDRDDEDDRDYDRRDERRPAERSRGKPQPRSRRDDYDPDRDPSPRGHRNLDRRSRIPESGYAARNLIPGERILHSANLHPIVFLRPILGIILGIVALIVRGAILREAHQEQARLAATITGIGVIVVSALMMLNAILDYVSSEFIVTNRQIILKTGFLRRKTLELFHNRIHAFTIDQSILGRLFNYGDFTIRSAAGDQYFQTVADPLEFRRQVNSQQDI